MALDTVNLVNTVYGVKSCRSVCVNLPLSSRMHNSRIPLLDPSRSHLNSFIRIHAMPEARVYLIRVLFMIRLKADTNNRDAFISDVIFESRHRETNYKTTYLKFLPLP